MSASGAMDAARRELLDRRDSVAIEILQDSMEENLPTEEEEALLDSLQSLPRLPPPGAEDRVWRISEDLVVSPLSDLPLLGMFEVSRRILAFPGRGARLLGGLQAGSWLDGRRMGEGLDARFDLEAGDSTDFRAVGAWAGWTTDSELELGFSNSLRFSGRWDRWRWRQGPDLVASWRKTRWFGWSGELEEARWCFSGVFGWRQDPQWPDVYDGAGRRLELARAGIQSTIRAECRLGGRKLAFGPALDLDGRVLILPDRWAVDSTSPRVSSRRSAIQATPAAWWRWTPGPNFLLRGELGWAFAFQAGGAPLDLSPYLPGPCLRLGSSWRI